MKPAPFEYVAVASVGEALEALSADEDARPLAGGQSLVPLMNLRLARPALLVDINGIAELDDVRVEGDEVRIGALCRHRRIETDAVLGESAPLLAEAASFIGHAQIRNRGTIGGSLAHGDPVAELGAALLALGGRVVVARDGTRREIAAADHFRGFFETAVEPGELLVEVVVPARSAGTGAAFREFAPRVGDFAIAGIAATVTRSDGQCTAARAAGCGLSATPVDLSDVLGALVGASSLSEDLLREVASATAAAVEPTNDIHASADDRRELAQLLIVDALRVAWGRAA